ncbi:MAG: family 78 glycoside hydrolase catalytic domain, partial [Planctomycetota bacterium]
MTEILKTAVLLGWISLSGLVYSGEVYAAGDFVVEGLRCEHRVDPVGAGRASPSFEWSLRSARRGVSQSAYQIRVASGREFLTAGTACLWDSGRVSSEQSYAVVYGGRPLRSSRRYYWAVRAWDQNGKATGWSEPATFVTGLLSGDDWQAKWITANRTDDDPLPIFRKSVRLRKPVEQAIIHICGLGHYELRINGRRVGDHEMDPGWTNYRKTSLYSSYDVTNMLTPGENAIGAMLGNGMYNVPGGRYTKFKGTFGPPKLICRMDVTFTDGSTDGIVSDETWRCTPGPITFTCIFGGEDYDARRQQSGWDGPGFDDRAWNPAKICEGPGGKLVAQQAPPTKVIDYLPAVSIEHLDNGRYEVDCGTNLSARPVIAVRGPSGSQVFVTCAEKRGQPWLHNKGHTYTFTLKGEGDEVFRPRFTYFSFQYLYISGVVRPDDAGSEGRQPMLLKAGSEF